MSRASDSHTKGSLVIVSGQAFRSDPCISSITTSIMITSSISPVNRRGYPIKWVGVLLHTMAMFGLSLWAAATTTSAMALPQWRSRWVLSAKACFHRPSYRLADGERISERGGNCGSHGALAPAIPISIAWSRSTVRMTQRGR
jgi:hypothetical protein